MCNCYIAEVSDFLFNSTLVVRHYMYPRASFSIHVYTHVNKCLIVCSCKGYGNTVGLLFSALQFHESIHVMTNSCIHFTIISPFLEVTKECVILISTNVMFFW